MKAGVGLAVAAAVVGLAACATPPPPAPVPAAPPVERAAPADVAPVRTPLIESPPLEPVEPPTAAPTRTSPVAESVAEPAAPPVAEPAAPPVAEPVAEQAAETVAQPAAEPAATPVPTPAPAEPTEEQQLATLLADLQRFGAMNADEVRREIGSATQLLSRQRTDFNRIRLAVLYTLTKTPQDDQRAMQLFDSVAKNSPGSPAAKQLAAVVQVQVAERMRAVRDEQQKADAAVKKLEALRNMERDLLRDRIRSGGGGAGGGSSGGSGGGS